MLPSEVTEQPLLKELGGKEEKEMDRKGTAEKEISVIIPCYNVEPYIDACVESLVHQAFGLQGMEFIFVNDASTDGTYEKLLQWKARYEESIVVINLPQNRKQGGARNAGLQYAAGRYIGFCDSDDYVEADMYQILYQRLQESGADYAVCGRYEEHPDGTITLLKAEQDEVLDLKQEEFKGFLADMLAPGGVVQRLYSRSFLEKIQVSFPENLKYEDNYFIGIANYYTEKIAVVSKPLYHYRVNLNSTIQSRNALHHLDRLQIEEMKLEELKKRGLWEEHRTDIEFNFIKLYWINSIATLMNRFDDIPEGVIKRMQHTVKSYFPDGKENFLLKYYMSKEQFFLAELIDYPFEMGDREEVSKVLRVLGSGQL